MKHIREKREQGNPYDIALTDYKMPGGMDGIAFTRALRAFDHGETAVIILTGYSWDDIQHDALSAGADGIMSKPLFTDSLIREIRKVLSKRENALEDAQGQTEQRPEEKAGEDQGLSGCRVLVAEDFAINAEILIDLLDVEGIQAEHVENGQLAVELFQQKPEHYFDAVLMDVRMPVMDGLTATRAIRALDREDAKTIPIIALTANAFDDDVQRSLQSGMNAHLSKPVEPDRLYETLKRLICPSKQEG